MGTRCVLLYHVIWCTADRLPLLTPRVESWLHPHLALTARRIGCTMHVIGGTADHLHLALEIPAAMPVSNAIGKLKSGSAHHLHREIGIVDAGMWEEAHEVSTLSSVGLPRLVNYIRHQKEYHRDGIVEPALEPASGRVVRACALVAEPEVPQTRYYF